MSERALSLAFYDAERQMHGVLRSGMTLLFEGSDARAMEQGPEVTRDGDVWLASVEERLALEFAPAAASVAVGGAEATPCRVTGTVAKSRIECLGVASETVSPPRWDELDAARWIAAVFDPGEALFVSAIRPSGALGHDVEEIEAALSAGGKRHVVETARVSTVYDGDGRQRTAGLELWVEGEDFPRRAAGSVVAGTTLELQGLVAHASIFEWQMDGRSAFGSYDVTVREPEPAAA